MPRTSSQIQILDELGNPIDPATENKQDDIITAIEDISDQQVATDMEGGGKISVGTSAVEVTFTGTPTESIIITADMDNTGILYVGKSNVATDGSNAFVPLFPNESAIIDYNDSSNAVYVVGSAASQNFWKGALL